MARSIREGPLEITAEIVISDRHQDRNGKLANDLPERGIGLHRAVVGKVAGQDAIVRIGVMRVDTSNALPQPLAPVERRLIRSAVDVQIRKLNDLHEYPPIMRN